MPKKSKKSKSRRETLKHKYKVVKKVKEHHKKLRKQAKKNGTLRKEPKDPGIPNAWPFKEELLQGLQASKERAKLRMKEMRERVEAAKEDMEEDVGFEEQDYVDYSVKAFYKDFAKVVEASDVIIKVLDARDPIGTRCKDVEKFVRKMDPSKRVVLLLNKIDLVPKRIVEGWLGYLREELPTVAFKSSTQKQSRNLGRKAAGQTMHQGSECLGADIVIQLLKNYARGQGGLKTAITVGIVGLPNVGKSSIINSLKRSKVAKVGNQPGVTKNIQEVSLDRKVTLLDSPGVVFSNVGSDGQAAAALRNCVKVENLDDPALPISEILRRCPPKQLMTLYRIPEYEHVDDFLEQVATVRGKLKRGGTVDKAAAAKIILQDWNEGKIPYYTAPPKRDTEVKGSATVVSSYSSDFDLSSLENEKAQVIDALEDTGMDDEYFETETAGEVHVDLEDNDAMMVEDEEKGRGQKQTNQSDKLYNNIGQYNPHKAKSASKRKKQSADDMEMDDGDSDSDFDFQEDALPEGHDNMYAVLEDS